MGCRLCKNSRSYSQQSSKLLWVCTDIVLMFYGDTGWLSDKYQKYLSMLIFWNRLIRMPNDRVAKKFSIGIIKMKGITGAVMEKQFYSHYIFQTFIKTSIHLI